MADPPLHGLRVIEFGQLLAGPYTGTLLGDFGADVIKIEAPGSGDAMRDWGRLRHNDHSLWWSVMARGKRSVALNLRTDACRRLTATPGRIQEPARWEVGADTSDVLGDLEDEVEGLDLPRREGLA